MNFNLTEEQIMIQQAARDYAERELLQDVLERDAKAEFPLRAYHTVRTDASQCGRLNDGLVVQPGSDFSQGDDLSRLDVRRSAYHRSDSVTRVDRAHFQLIGFGVSLHGQHFGHDDAFECGTDSFHRFDFETDTGQSVRQIGWGQIDWDIVTKPLQTDFHSAIT